MLNFEKSNKCEQTTEQITNLGISE